MKVLVVNAGSTTLKYQLFNMDDSSVMAKGICERIGDGGRVEHKLPDGRQYCEDVTLNTHAEAAAIVVRLLTDATYGCISSLSEIGAVGHRIVHGGARYASSTLLEEADMEALEELKEICPLHLPGAIMGIRACLEAIPGVPQVGVFDTAFHQSMPAEAYVYPIPAELAKKHHIRKYGFHGTSHRYVSGIMASMLDKPLEETRIVTCHLGGGSSIAAVKGGKVQDTTMGFTPLDGLVMSTRCGSIDPAAVLYLMEKGKRPKDRKERYRKRLLNLFLRENLELVNATQEA